MTLPADYLTYPLRRYGMDQDRYAWRPAPQRGKIAWPNAAKAAVMIVVPIEFHMLNPSGKPFKSPGAMVTPYPDLRHYTTRDYGSRVGVFRLLKALKAHGLKATFPVNAAMLERVRPLIDAILAGGHEIAAYGVDTDHIHWSGLAPEVEAGYVAQTRAAFDRVGLSPRTWMSPARHQSAQTLDLIAAAGFDVCLDWEQDTVPVAMAADGRTVAAVPLSNELDDRQLLINRHQDEASWLRQITEALDLLKAEAPAAGGQVLGFTLTPYVSGQPFRTWAVRELCQRLAHDPALWTATASAIVDAVAAGAVPAR